MKNVRFLAWSASVVVAMMALSETASAATITYTPSTSTVTAGQSFTVQIFGSSVNDIGGFSLYLNSSAPVNLFRITAYTLNTSLFTYGGPGPTFPQFISTSQTSQDLGAFTLSDLTANTVYLLGTATISVNASTTNGDYQVGNSALTVFADPTFSTADNAPVNTFTISVVPEPSTWALLMMGGLGAVWMVRRRALAQA